MASLMSMSVRICSLEYESLNSGSINEERDFLCYKAFHCHLLREMKEGVCGRGWLITVYYIQA